MATSRYVMAPVEEWEYWQQHLNLLIPEYVGKYVLTRNHEILDSDVSLEALRERSRQRNLHGYLIFGVKTKRPPPGVVVGI